MVVTIHTYGLSVTTFQNESKTSLLVGLWNWPGGSFMTSVFSSYIVVRMKLLIHSADPQSRVVRPFVPPLPFFKTKQISKFDRYRWDCGSTRVIIDDAYLASFDFNFSLPCVGTVAEMPLRPAAAATLLATAANFANTKIGKVTTKFAFRQPQPQLQLKTEAEAETEVGGPSEWPQRLMFLKMNK